MVQIIRHQMISTFCSRSSSITSLKGTAAVRYRRLVIVVYVEFFSGRTVRRAVFSAARQLVSACRVRSNVAELHLKVTLFSGLSDN